MWLGLALRAWGRGLASLTAISIVVFSPVLWLAGRASTPATLGEARALIQLGWICAGGAIALQLLLVAAAAPVVRGAGGFRASVGKLVRAIVPWAVAMAACCLGGVALVVPGAVLVVMFAWVGASERIGEPLPAPLVDAARAARQDLKRLAATIAVIVVANVIVALAAQLVATHGWPEKPAPALLVHARTAFRVVAIVIALVAPVPACVIATLYEARR